MEKNIYMKQNKVLYSQLVKALISVIHRYVEMAGS